MVEASDSTYQVLVLSAAICLTFAGLFLAFWLGYWISTKQQGQSPYTGSPLRRCTDLTYFAAERVLRYMYNIKQYDNQVFKLRKSAYCRETGRIFINCVSIFNTVNVDWTFISKRYRGNYVSWGSLTRDQKIDIANAHESLEKFQTTISSPEPSPRNVASEYVFVKPGPLYVDVNTKVLVGWQEVPDTGMEVLIVQKPKYH